MPTFIAHVFPILFCCIIYVNAIGQSNLIDSLDMYYYTKGEKFLEKDLDSAFHYFELTEPIAKANKNWEIYIDTYNGKAFCYYFKGDISNALRIMIIAEKEAKKYLSEKSMYYSAILNNIGAILDEKGDLKNAIKYLKKSAKIDLITKANKLSKALTFHNLSAAYRSIGDFDQGIFYENKALQLRTDTLGKNSAVVASSLATLGHLYRDKNELNQALIYYKDFLKIVDKLDALKSLRIDEIVHCYQSISKIYIKQKKYVEAYDYIQKAFELQEGKNNPRRIQSYEVLGDWYMEQGEQKKAIKNHQKAKTYFYKAYNNDDQKVFEARILKNLANAYLANNNIDSALYNFQSALIELSVDFNERLISATPTVNQMLSKYEGIQILDGKSHAFLKKYQLKNDQKDLLAAFEHFQMAATIVKKLRDDFITDGSKNELAEKALSIYEGGIKTAFLLFQNTNKEEYLRAAWNFAEQNKARLLEESLQENYARLTSGLPNSELEKEQALRVEINYLEKKINEEKGKQVGQDDQKMKLWNTNLFDLKKEYGELIEHFENEYPLYYSSKYDPKNTSLEKIRSKLLSQKNALLEYFVGNEYIYLFCLTKDDIQVFEFETPTNFTENIVSIRSTISHSPFETTTNFDTDRNQFVSLSNQLYNALLKPGIDILPKDVSSLVIIPDDILAYLPFELLLMNKAKENSTDYSTQSCDYLFEQYDISYNYSVSLLAKQSDWKYQNNTTNFLGIAPSFDGPIADNSRSCLGENMSALKCNSQEVEAIYNLLGGKSIQGIAANIKAFRDKAQQARILHLATHACVDNTNPNLNKIYFSDNYITSSDLYNLKLNAELTVLSACNTGSGKLIKGEGIMSLSRAFILTGCSSTLMSLWSVDDCTTADIMLNFYENLKNGFGKDKALKTAKINYLSTADKVGTHPYYWAAFVQSGNAKPMIFSGGSGYLKYWFFALLLIPILILFRKK